MAFITWLKSIKLGDVPLYYYFWPLKWGAFLKGTYNIENVPFEFCEIVVYRSIMCPVCVERGKCTICGCKEPDAMMDLGNHCAGFNWDSITIEQWIEYKKRTGLKFTIEYGG